MTKMRITLVALIVSALIGVSAGPALAHRPYNGCWKWVKHCHHQPRLHK